MTHAVHADALTGFVSRFLKALDDTLDGVNSQYAASGRAPVSLRRLIEERGGEALYRQFGRARKSNSITPSLYQTIRQQVMAPVLDADQLGKLDRFYRYSYVRAQEQIDRLDLTLKQARSRFDEIFSRTSLDRVSNNLDELEAILEAATSGLARKNLYEEAAQNALVLSKLLPALRKDLGLGDDEVFSEAMSLVNTAGVASALTMGDHLIAMELLVTLQDECNVYLKMPTIPETLGIDPYRIASAVSMMNNHNFKITSLVDPFHDRIRSKTHEGGIVGVVQASIHLQWELQRSQSSRKLFKSVPAVHAISTAKLIDMLMFRMPFRPDDPTQIRLDDLPKNLAICHEVIDRVIRRLIDDKVDRSLKSSAYIAAAGLSLTPLTVSENDRISFDPSKPGKVTAQLLLDAYDALIREKNSSHATWSNWYIACARYMEYVGSGIGMSLALFAVKDLRHAIRGKSFDEDFAVDEFDRALTLNAQLSVDGMRIMRLLRATPPTLADRG